MKIIISPSKTMKISKINKLKEETVSISKEQSKITDTLIEKIQGHSKENIGKKMKVKGKLLEQVYDNIHRYHLLQEGHAISSYSGTVYKEILIHTYNEEQLHFLKEHVVILSALYGPIPAYYPIKSYRLDMTMNLFEENLYKVWEPIVEEVFKKEEKILNLASKEFSKLVKKPMLSVEFLQDDGKEVKPIAFHSKQARGALLHYIIENQIENVKGLKEFSCLNYTYQCIEKDEQGNEMLYYIRKWSPKK